MEFTMRQVALAIILLFAPVLLNAVTIHVPAGQITIQAGIDVATAGDTVLVTCGTYYEHEIAMKSGVYLTSMTGEANCVTIDAQQQGRGFYCNEVDMAASIVGFTITEGLAAGSWPNNAGGGMLCWDSSLTITNCSFSSNSAYYGGGLLCEDYSSPTVTNCSFSNNSTGGGSGGGMYCRYSNSTITDCTFVGNTAFGGGGGGLSFRDANATITNCMFIGNLAQEGGGISIGSATATITDCTFSGNSASVEGGGGGGIKCGGDLNTTITNCTFSGNMAHDGGGLELWYCNATVSDCTFSGNSASLGGGMHCSSSYPTITSCIFYSNSATYYGGGIRCTTSSPLITSCSFFGNSAQNGGAMHLYWSSNPTITGCIVAFNLIGSAIDCHDSSPVLTCCDIYGNEGGDWIGYIVDQLGVDGNFTADPQFCGVEGSGNYYLQNDSPCAPGNHPDGWDCGLIGAFDVACGPVAIEESSWSQVKSLY
jgi:predicted outer membrane repeat protein